MGKAPAYRRQVWYLPNAHVGRHSPTKAGISIGRSSAAGMTPGIPKSRKESHPERAGANEDQTFHIFFYVSPLWANYPNTSAGNHRASGGKQGLRNPAVEGMFRESS